jgi:hypothetical protein
MEHWTIFRKLVHEDSFVLQASLTSSTWNISNDKNPDAGTYNRVHLRAEALKKWRSSFEDSTASANRRLGALGGWTVTLHCSRLGSGHY